MSGTVQDAASALAVGVSALTEQVRQAFADPADQIRILISLATFEPPIPTYTDPLGLEIVAAAEAAAALCQRAALISLALATSVYLPQSQQEAFSLRSTVCDMLDDAATAAADAGDNNTYSAFRAMRTAVANDLATRAALLPALIAYTFAAPLPSLAVAWLLYGDISRANEIANRAEAPHPGFLPLSFVALSS
jgi:prophage DNA circulation protein